MLANDLLYREENKAEYQVGVEVLVFSHAQDELAFAQVGQPHLFLARQSMPWIPLSVQVDLSTELSMPGDVLPPLPQNLLGLHTTTNLNVSSFRTQPGDRMVFMSHSVVSHPLYATPFEKTGLDAISESLSNAHPDLPFWLGVLSF